jgi:hypothetical protein
MVVPQSQAGKIATVLGILFILMVTPPVALLVSTPTLIFGIAAYYLWMTVWGVFISVVLIWAAWRDAYTLTNDQVPPELRETERVATEQTGVDTAEGTAQEGS